MFIRTKSSGYTAAGEQRASGDYLALFHLQSGGELRAIIRSVTLKQLGHFMMGFLTVAGKKFSVSGALGQDGLPLECPYDPLWDALVPLPDELAKTVWADDGHNTVGKAAGPLKKWALANMVPLKRAGTKIVWSVSLVEPVHRGEIVVFGGPNCRADVKGMLGVVVGEHGVISVDIPALKERRTFTDAVPGYLSGFHRYVGDRPENMRLRLFVCTRNDCTHTAAAVKSWVETNTESLIEKAHTVLDRCPECGSPINFIL